MPKGSPSSNTLEAQGVTKAFTFWQDREIRFDATPDVFTMRPNAEEVLATFHHVEDTKGNNGQVGTLLVTNLRVIWWSAKHRTVNLSIGYYCVLNITVQETQSKLFGGPAEAIFVSSKFGSSRFMFVFTYVPKANDVVDGVTGARSTEGQTRLFSAMSAARRSYELTRTYREIRLRGAIVANGNAVLLQGEHVLSKLTNVVNVSKATGHPGTLVITNLRVVWFATGAENLNASIPYMQFVAVRRQSSRFGPALVVETSKYAGNFVLGFRVEPVERLLSVYQEIVSMWKAWTHKPHLGMRTKLRHDGSGDGGVHNDDDDDEEVFENDLGTSEAGVGSREKEVGASTAAGRKGGRGGKVVISETGGIEQAPGDAFAAYYADEGQKGTDRKPVFDPEIGLAVEKLRKGVTLQDLWNITVK